MKVIFPRCPKCKNIQTVGRVKSYSFKKSNGMTAYYCSNCLTEFDRNSKILMPIWADAEFRKSIV